MCSSLFMCGTTVFITKNSTKMYIEINSIIKILVYSGTSEHMKLEKKKYRYDAVSEYL